jgi:hypothetical protein
LSENEFWQLTLPEWNALVERYEAEQSYADYRAGIIASAMINGLKPLAQSWGVKFKNDSTITPLDFGLPFLKKPEPKVTALSDYIMFMHIRAVNAAMGGKVIENG